MGMDSISFGNKVRKYRKLNNLTQEKLSEMIDITPNYMSHIERGKVVSTVDKIIKIANILNVTPDILLQDSIKKITKKDDEIAALIQDCTEDEILLIKNLIIALNATKKQIVENSELK